MKFDHDKECLIETFKGLVRPFFDYAAPIVFPAYTISEEGVGGCHPSALR